jgi:hypothetical protein
MLLQLVTAKGTAIGATIAAMAAVSGDSLAIPSFNDQKKGYLLQAWVDAQVAGTFRIRSPKMHDNVNGIRVDTVISDPTPFLPWGVPVRMWPSDVLTLELAGSAVAGDEEFACLLMAYEDLPGQVGRLVSPDDVTRRTVHLLTVENTIATGTTGIWTGAESINAEIDQFQQNLDYAILGYKVDTECAAIGYRAPSFANVRVGGPGIETESWLTADWFLRLSRAYGMPLVPVFSGSDKSSVLIDSLQDENGADVTVTTFLAALSKG